MKNFFITAFIFSLIVSCDLIVDVNIPESKQKLVVDCIYGDSSWRANISHSRHILDSGYFEGIGGAIIKITEEETGETFTLDSGAASDGTYSLKGRPARYNSPYRLEVSKEGFETIHATMTVPPPVSIKNIKLDSVFDSDYNDKKLTVSLTFTDPPGENYYGVFMTYTAPSEYQEHTPDTVIIHYDTLELPAFPLETEDPIVEEFMKTNGQLVFNDRTFENREYTFVYNFPPYYRSRGEKTFSIRIFLFSLSKDYYSYYTTLRLQEWTKGDPFAEPVNVYNNINNGFGVFAGYSSDVKQIIP